MKGGGKSGKMAGGPFEINGTCNIKLGLYRNETLVLFNQGVGPQKKSDASCN